MKAVAKEKIRDALAHLAICSAHAPCTVFSNTELGRELGFVQAYTNRQHQLVVEVISTQVKDEGACVELLGKMVGVPGCNYGVFSSPVATAEDGADLVLKLFRVALKQEIQVLDVEHFDSGVAPS